MITMLKAQTIPRTKYKNILYRRTESARNANGLMMACGLRRRFARIQKLLEQLSSSTMDQQVERRKPPLRADVLSAPVSLASGLPRGLNPLSKRRRLQTEKGQEEERKAGHGAAPTVGP